MLLREYWWLVLLVWLLSLNMDRGFLEIFLYWKTVDDYWKFTHQQTRFWAACSWPMEQLLRVVSLARSSWIVLYFRTPAQPDYWSLGTCQFPVSWLFFCSFSHRLKEPSSEGREWTRLLADSQLPSPASTSSLLMSTLVNHCSRYHYALHRIAHKSLKGLQPLGNSPDLIFLTHCLLTFPGPKLSTTLFSHIKSMYNQWAHDYETDVDYSWVICDNDGGYHNQIFSVFTSEPNKIT